MPTLSWEGGRKHVYLNSNGGGGGLGSQGQCQLNVLLASVSSNYNHFYCDLQMMEYQCTLLMSPTSIFQLLSLEIQNRHCRKEFSL